MPITQHHNQATLACAAHGAGQHRNASANKTKEIE